MADPSLRVASFTVNLQRDGPGLLLRDIERGAPDVVSTAQTIAHITPDVVLLTGFDFDADGVALKAYAKTIRGLGGPDYAHLFAPRDNSGRPSGLDVDGDGLLDGSRDAHGYGSFAGQGALALLSVYPLGTADTTGVREVWSDQPGARRPVGMSDDVWSGLSLMERGGWSVPVLFPPAPFVFWAAYASPPVFDGPEDRNGLRNAAQITYWIDRADTDPEDPIVLAGDLNIDPVDGQGRKLAIRSLLSHPNFTDPRPRSAGAALAGQSGASANHTGPHALDTVDWSSGPGNLRVDYLLPSTHWRVLDAGVFWPAPQAPETRLLSGEGGAGSRHRLVWVDLVLQR